MQLTPEDLARLQTKEVANAIRKLHAGKTLTGAERTLLAHATVGAETPTPAAFVGTWDELAQRLGVSRRAIQDWRNDPRYQTDIEKRWPLLERADGRHCVAEWLRLMVDLNLKRGAAAADIEVIPDEDDESGGAGVIKPPPVAGSQADWNRAIAALDHRKKENAVRVQEGTLLLAAELEVPLGATFAALQTKLAQFPARTARYFVGLRDVAEIEDRLRDELDADLGDLHAARFTAEDAVAAAVAAVPFDADSEALLKLVTFASQDRDALMRLITSIATEALRQLGRRAITTATGADSKAVPESDPLPSSEASPIAPSAMASASADAAAPHAAPAKARGGKAASKARVSGAEKSARRKPRPQPAAGPAEVEAAIIPEPRRRKTRRR